MHSTTAREPSDQAAHRCSSGSCTLIQVHACCLPSVFPWISCADYFQDHLITSQDRILHLGIQSLICCPGRSQEPGAETVIPIIVPSPRKAAKVEGATNCPRCSLSCLVFLDGLPRIRLMILMAAKIPRGDPVPSKPLQPKRIGLIFILNLFPNESLVPPPFWGHVARCACPSSQLRTDRWPSGVVPTRREWLRQRIHIRRCHRYGCSTDHRPVWKP